MYAIMVDYYVWDVTSEMETTKPMYLGIAYPPKNVYVFDEEHNSRSFRWGNKAEAEKYLQEHPQLTENTLSYKNVRVVEVDVK